MNKDLWAAALEGIDDAFIEEALDDMKVNALSVAGNANKVDKTGAHVNNMQADALTAAANTNKVDERALMSK